MIKKELIQAVAKETKFKQKDVDLIVEATIEKIMETVSGGEKVTIVNFGVFEPKTKAEKRGTNPSNGKPLVIPAKTVPAFRAGEGFKDRIKKTSKSKSKTKNHKSDRSHVVL